MILPRTLLSLIPLLTAAASQGAETRYPSRYGPADTLGAINNLSAEKVLQAARLVTTGKTYALAVETGWDPPRTRRAPTP